MKFLKKLSQASLRKIFILISLFCLFAVLYVFVRTMFTDRIIQLGYLLKSENTNGEKIERGFLIDSVFAGGSADLAGIKKGDILLEIGGKEFRTRIELLEILSQYESNELIEFTLLRDNAVIKTYPVAKTREIEFRSHFVFIIFGVLGFGFLVIGFLVGYSKPKEFTSQLFYFLGCTAALEFATLGGINLSDDFALFISYLGMFFFPLTIHFFLTYPIRIDFKNRSKFLAVSYVLIVLLSTPSFFIEEPIDYDYDTLTIILGILLVIILIAYIVTGAVFFFKSYSKLKNTNLEKPLRIILYGMIIGLTGPLITIVVLIIFRVFNLDRAPDFISISLLLMISSVIAIPASFGYSIFKYRILDTEFIVKKGIVFGLTLAFLIGVYFTLVFMLNRLIKTYTPIDNEFIIIGTIIVTLSFNFVRIKVQEFVDKQFYRERYNYRKSLLHISEELPYLINISQIVEKITRSVKDTMGVNKVNVLFEENDFNKIILAEMESKALNKEPVDAIANVSIKTEDGTENTNDISRLFKKSKSHKMLNDIYLHELDISQQLKEMIRNEKLVLAIPIFVRDKFIGAIAFGEKSSGKAYSEEDIDLLKTLASHASIAFENTRLQQQNILNQKTEEEIDIARKVQRGLLPRTISIIEGMDLSGFYMPARTIGGDFYDIIKLSDTKILVVVADVSGKGIPAALIMSRVQGMIQIYGNLFQSPKKILAEVNNQIHGRISKKTFITSVVAVFDLEAMTVKISSAGHNPVIYSENGKFKFLKNKGMSLGLTGNKLFEGNIEEKEMNISHDNIFVFYSDGLTESMNNLRDEFGEDKLIRALEESRKNACNIIQDKIIDSVDRFRGNAEQNDDITLVVIKIK